jgi:hypothetical protein
VARLITLGTPHEGASRADVYCDWWLYRLLFGPAGQQLTTTHAAGEPWPWPAGVPVTAIAGSRAPHGYHPWIPGDDDGTVELASASPPEADEAVLVRRTHTFLMSHPEVAATILRYALADEASPAPDSPA